MKTGGKNAKRVKLTDPVPNITKPVVNPYIKPWNDSDIILIVDKEEFHCHYTILMLNSPVFSAMFKDNCKEGKEKKAVLPGKEKESFKVFLDLMYPLSVGYEASTDRKILHKVLEYANEYIVESVKLHIDNMLFTKVYARDEISKTAKLAMEDLRMSEKYGLKEVRRCTFKILMADDSCSSYDETVFNELSGDIKFDIITGKLKEFLPTLPVKGRRSINWKLLASISKVDSSMDRYDSDLYDSYDEDGW